jgi:hypothetical protein
MLDKSSWQEMDSNVLQKSTSTVQETASISITYSEDQQGVRTILKISSRYVKHVTGGCIITPPSQEIAVGSLPAMV